MAHPVDEEQLACSAFDAGFSFKAPEESLNKEGERYRGSRLVEGVESTAKNLYENSASVRLAAQGLSKVGQGLNWISEPLIQASEQNETAPIYPGAMIEGRSPNALLGDAIKGVQGLVGLSEEGAEIRGNQFNIDPRLSRFVGGAAAEALLEVGAGKLFNRAKKLKINQNTRSPLLATVDGTPTRLPNLGKGDDFWSPSNVFASTTSNLPTNVRDIQIARKNKGNKKFLDELSKKTKFMDDYISKHGRTYTGENQFITMPDTGDQFKYMWKDKRMSWRNWTQEVKQKLTRLNNQKPDTKSIRPLMEKHVGAKHADKATELYVETNTKVFNEVDHAIKRHNKAIKAKKKAAGLTKAEINDKADLLSLEHIFDVNFYERLKELVPNFQARGANEMGNISALNNVLNVKTGAANKKISIHDAFINNIKSGKGFPDYNKSIGDFVEYDVGNRVKNFSEEQWDEFLGQVIKREDVNVQEILIDMLKKENRIEDSALKTLVDLRSNGF